jgi:uncharacterized membrane protein YedE/YeeE
MLKVIHANRGLQLVLGLLIGIAFGFLLHKGGVTRYEVIIGQLLFTDFTVLKVMLTAVLTGMLGIHMLKGLGLVRLHIKDGSFGSSVVGGLIFGVGFGILGYCPGTVAAAAGRGALDALFGGVVGTILGAGIFAALYPKLQKSILSKGYFGELTLPKLLKLRTWQVVIPVAFLLTALLLVIERAGL